MAKTKKFIFQPYDEITNLILTQCAITDEPDIVVAIMGEDIPDGYEDPLFLGNKYTVVLPQIIVGYAKEVTIWFSKEVPPDTMSALIQEYFDLKFPNLEITEKSSMGVSEAGKIVILQDG